MTAPGTHGSFTATLPTDTTPMSPPASQFLQIVTLSLGFVACTARETVPTPRISVTPIPSPAGPNSAEPFLSTSEQGTLTLSWLQREPDSVTVALRLASADSTGTWGPVAEIVKSRDLFVNWADFPSVVSLADGRLLAHWLQKNGKGTYAYDVRLAESLDGGASWSANVPPHAPGIPAEHGFVTLLPRGDSTADVVFLNGSVAPLGTAEGRGPPMRLAAARWNGAGIAIAPETILDQRTCDCCQTAAAMTTAGPVVLYRDRSETETRDISVTRLVNGTWTPATPLHADNWTIDACPVNGPAIAAEASRVAAVWFTGARDTAKVQLAFSSDAGATFGAPVRIDGGMPAGRVDVELLPDGDALVSWIERTSKDSSAVRVRIVHADGTADAPVTVADLGAGRATGFPRMARRRDDIAIAWTRPGKPSAVALASIRIARR